MKYRLNVAAILQDRTGKILICERVGGTGAWQFPQGGVDAGETHQQALARELIEEISLRPAAYEIVEKRGPYRYEYAAKHKGYDGKKQYYFLAHLTGAKSSIDVATKNPEFRKARWIAPETFDLEWLPRMKRPVYAAVFRDLLQVKLRRK